MAVVQPLPGIGDMVWHVAHIRAIAAWVGAPVTVLTKPRSLADQLFADEPAVQDVQWIDTNPIGRRGRHDGLLGFFRLVSLFRAGGYRSVVFLHHSRTLAMAARLAGIRDRRGYGWGSQRPYLNRGPFLPKSIAKRHQLKRATAWIEAAGIPLASDEPRLGAAPALREAARRHGGLSEPFIAMGIGSSEPERNWGVEKFAALSELFLDAGWPAIVLVGAEWDAANAEAIRLRSGHPDRVTAALGWPLPEVMGLLAEAALCVANNTGVMNLAAALGTRTYGVFGTTFPFDHAREIRRVMSPDIGIDDGAGRVTLDMMVDTILADRGDLSPGGAGSIGNAAPVRET
ncbi:MAG TPA: glycosyltransferase family 9 protein [Rhodopila sp.]|uniref:glycosyltransferase family 9 protein n=1 Tax=Rhodopila sp. TaxID=2480087 RepID=UPI002CF74F79|nr:glycosyltransferase family 9 protein [Rhodopila sp.]HVY16806.1 glycosyltransferase family 9 protein [Rhodopila sp.]